MKHMTLLLLAISSASIAGPKLPDAEQVALTFNKWYMQQINQEKEPIEGTIIDKYVTRDTLKKLRMANKPQHADDMYYDSDFFIKTQDWDKDWVTDVTVLFGDYDPVCTTAYIAFGKNKKHIIADCMVQEDGEWKIQSVSIGSASDVITPIK